LNQLLTNPIFLSGFFSWMMAQTLKVLVNLFRGKPQGFEGFFLEFLWKTGGMPSSHSAAVVALTTAVGFIEGIGSTVFMVSLGFTLIVIRDALGVRRASGLQARVLNNLIREYNHETGKTLKLVKEVHGHTFPEVTVGVILGFFIAVAFCRL
jgi:uncharacterized protein